MSDDEIPARLADSVRVCPDCRSRSDLCAYHDGWLNGWRDALAYRPGPPPADGTRSRDSRGGRHRHDSPRHVVEHAERVDAPRQRRELLALISRQPRTSRQLATAMARTYGDASAAARTNQIGARLGELFADRKAAPLRSRGQCWHGICHPADDHRPSTPCGVHGDPIVEDGAMMWAPLHGDPPRSGAQPELF